MADWKMLLEIGAPLAAAASTLFYGARWVGRYEESSKQLAESLKDVKKIPVIEQRVGRLEDDVKHHLRAEHPAMAAKLDDIGETAIRAELASQTDLATGE